MEIRGNDRYRYRVVSAIFCIESSELFPDLKEEWKDQYTKYIQSASHFCLFQFLSPVADCPIPLNHISRMTSPWSKYTFQYDSMKY